MMRKVLIVTDTGIDGAFATVLALFDPQLDVEGLAATAGKVRAEQATSNVQIIVEQVDPPRWPRLGAALPVDFEIDCTRLHGHGGLGGTSFPCAKLHHQHSSDKLLIDVIRQYPRDVTVICLGPLTALARAFDRDPELPSLVQRIVCVGGSWHEPGTVTPVAEFHMYCDPVAARQVLRCGAPLTLIPLDVTRKLLFAPGDLLELPSPESRACQFLRQMVPYGIRMTSSLYGIEGFHLKDVVGVTAVTIPETLTTKSMAVDIEVRGELTRGMTVIDSRPTSKSTPNVDLAVGINVAAVREYIHRVLQGVS